MLKSLTNLKVISSYIEQARGVKQSTWDKMKEQERREYIKNNPTSKYASEITLPTQIKLNENSFNRFMEHRDSFNLNELTDFIGRLNPVVFDKLGSYDTMRDLKRLDFDDCVKDALLNSPKFVKVFTEKGHRISENVIQSLTEKEIKTLVDNGYPKKYLNVSIENGIFQIFKTYQILLDDYKSKDADTKRCAKNTIKLHNQKNNWETLDKDFKKWKLVITNSLELERLNQMKTLFDTNLKQLKSVK